MSLFRFIVRGNMGQGPGDPWEFTQWVDSTASHGAVHFTATQWAQTWWDGPSPGLGFGDMVVSFIQVTEVETSVVEVSTGGQLSQIKTDQPMEGRSAAAASLPMHVAIVVGLKTSIANRSGRGRFFMPPVALEHVTLGGRFKLSSLTQIRDAVEAAFVEWVGVGTPVLYRRTSRTIEPLTGFSVDNELDLMRRRKISIPPLVLEGIV